VGPPPNHCIRIDTLRFTVAAKCQVLFTL
jgi:hypothetical protein